MAQMSPANTPVTPTTAALVTAETVRAQAAEAAAIATSGTNADTKIAALRGWKDVRTAFGAKCDLKIGVDGHMTNGSQTLTSALITAADVGKKFSVVGGAGYGGNPLVGTIVSAGAGTAVTDQWPNATTSNMTIYIGTDDTTAFRAALTDWDANGRNGTIYVPASMMIAGALQDTSLVNAQLIVPFATVSATLTKFGTLNIVGALAPNVIQYVGGTTDVHVPDLGGTILYSPLVGSGVHPTVFAAGNASLEIPTAGAFNQVNVHVTDLGIRTHFLSGMSAWGLLNAQTIELTHVVADTAETLQQMTTLGTPQYQSTFGFQVPGDGNGAHTVLRNCFARGYNVGFELMEWANVDDVQAMHNFVGFQLRGGGFTVRGGALRSQWNHVGIYAASPQRFDFQMFTAEHAFTGWYVTTADIYDVSNQLQGHIASGSFNTTGSDGGTYTSNNALTKTGATGVVIDHTL